MYLSIVCVSGFLLVCLFVWALLACWEVLSIHLETTLVAKECRAEMSVRAFPPWPGGGTLCVQWGAI